jgi:cysteinyl-tRNA synthetase
MAKFSLFSGFAGVLLMVSSSLLAQDAGLGFIHDTGIRVSSTATTNVLTWPNARATAFTSTQVRRGATGFPATISDGTLVTQNTRNHIVDRYQVTANTTMYYSFFAQDTDNQWIRKKTLSATTRTIVQQKQDMKTLVKNISAYSKGRKPGFIVIPNNGLELLTTPNGWGNEPLDTSYTNSIDGFMIESVYYLNSSARAPQYTDFIKGYLDTVVAGGKKVFMIDYFNSFSGDDTAKIDTFYTSSSASQYVGLASTGNLNLIPSYPATPYQVNTDDIASLSQVKNFLYLISPYPNFLTDIAATNYDAVFVDMLTAGSTSITQAEVTALKAKNNGHTRLVFAYMSVGQLSNYRYYFDPLWATAPPVWAEDPDGRFAGSYWIHYWAPQWHRMLYGSSEAYVDKIIDLGFDGVILDVVDAYNHFQ